MRNFTRIHGITRHVIDHSQPWAPPSFCWRFLIKNESALIKISVEEGEQAPRLERFHNPSISSDLPGNPRGLLIGRHQNNRNAACGSPPFELLADRLAVYASQQEIQEDQVGKWPLEVERCLLNPDLYVIARFYQQEHKCVGDACIILNQENAFPSALPHASSPFLVAGCMLTCKITHKGRSLSWCASSFGASSPQNVVPIRFVHHHHFLVKMKQLEVPRKPPGHPPIVTEKNMNVQHMGKKLIHKMSEMEVHIWDHPRIWGILPVCCF